MPGLRSAVIILGIIVGFCLLSLLGGYFGKKLEVFRVVIGAAVVAIVVIIIFAIYSAWYLLTQQA
jgi:hypothetical protein